MSIDVEFTRTADGYVVFASRRGSSLSDAEACKAVWDCLYIAPPGDYVITVGKNSYKINKVVLA